MISRPLWPGTPADWVVPLLRYNPKVELVRELQDHLHYLFTRFILADAIDEQVVEFEAVDRELRKILESICADLYEYRYESRCCARSRVPACRCVLPAKTDPFGAPQSRIFPRRNWLKRDLLQHPAYRAIH